MSSNLRRKQRLNKGQNYTGSGPRIRKRMKPGIQRGNGERDLLNEEINRTQAELNQELQAIATIQEGERRASMQSSGQGPSLFDAVLRLIEGIVLVIGGALLISLVETSIRYIGIPMMIWGIFVILWSLVLRRSGGRSREMNEDIADMEEGYGGMNEGEY